ADPQHQKHADRYPGAEALEPARRLQVGRGDRDAQAGQRDDRAMAEREEQPRPARHARAHAGAGASQPIDRHQVIGIEAVPETEREYERDQPGHFWMNKSSQSLVHFSCSSSALAGSTTV